LQRFADVGGSEIESFIDELPVHEIREDERGGSASVPTRGGQPIQPRTVGEQDVHEEAVPWAVHERLVRCSAGPGGRHFRETLERPLYRAGMQDVVLEHQDSRTIDRHMRSLRTASLETELNGKRSGKPNAPHGLPREKRASLADRSMIDRRLAAFSVVVTENAFRGLFWVVRGTAAPLNLLDHR
jgi:hypothetical protein